jgi:hypothetical protein
VTPVIPTDRFRLACSLPGMDNSAGSYFLFFIDQTQNRNRLVFVP